MLFIPTSYVSIKAPILGLLILIITIDIVRNGALLSKQTLSLLFLYSLVGLLYSFYGQLNGNAGAFRVISTQVLWPLCYLFISTLSLQVNFFIYFTRTLIFSLVCIVIYTFIYLGHDVGIVPGFLYFELDQGQSFGLYEGFIEYKLHTITSLIFLVPMLFHITWNDISQKKIHLPKIFLCFLSLILVFLTGRKAFWLIILLLPIIIVFSNLVLNSKRLPYNPIVLLFKSPILICLLFFVVATMTYILFNKFGLNINTLFNEFVNGFDPEASAGANSNLRTIQFHSLMSGWYDSNLIFGSGNGGQVEVVRDVDMPWAYELTYIYMLFSTGLFGVLFFLFWFICGILRLRLAMLSDSYLSISIPPMLTGVFCIMIASATNPYFAKFDYLWIVCLPHLLVDGARFVRLNR
ncbi:hypothetical protein [Shewanella denitrificans]|uniref:hypothetical protein n=1 Tax=Shewanella denitrificans TaxID=192073 RepID=UPI0012F74927|nr:hypothetical protein [Shewanella denitrificans]